MSEVTLHMWMRRARKDGVRPEGDFFSPPRSTQARARDVSTWHDDTWHENWTACFQQVLEVSGAGGQVTFRGGPP